MTALGPFFVACVLLVVAGTAKALRPRDTALALAGFVPGVGAGMLRSLVRLGAAVEAAVGAVALVVPGPLTGALVAASYAVFTVFVIVALVRGGPLATCGCFGTPDTPSTLLHVVIDVGLATSAVVVALSLPAGDHVWSLLASMPWRGIPFLAASGVSAYLALVAMTVMARLTAARRLVASVPFHHPGGPDLETGAGSSPTP